MKEHIALTLKEISARIQDLTLLRGQLCVEFGGGETPPAFELPTLPLDELHPHHTETGGVPPPKPKRGKRRAHEARRAKSGERREPLSPLPSSISRSQRPRSAPGGGLTVKDLIRAAVAGWSGEFSLNSIRSALLQKHPESEKRVETSLAMATRQLAAAGELKLVRRDGKVPIYTRGHVKPSVNADGHQLLAQIHQEEAAKLGN